MEIVSVALDLGTTKIKLGLLNEHQEIEEIVIEDAPEIIGEDPIRESDASAYYQKICNLISSVQDRIPSPIPIGISTQRSSFLIWGKKNGKPVTELISWQDRRASHWCENNQNRNDEFKQVTGLYLSSHYLAPKLKNILDNNNKLKNMFLAGDVLVGSLDTYLIWMLSRGKYYCSDLTMAARSLCVDVKEGVWSSELAKYFQIPIKILPKIYPSYNQNLQLNKNFILNASLADQAANILGVLELNLDSILVNLGTGAFVLRPLNGQFVTLPGYLTGAICKNSEGKILYSLEGTINGAANVLNNLTKEEIFLREDDNLLNKFCLPDVAGLGSPYWLADVGLTFSDNNLNEKEKKQSVYEGLIFRVCEIIKDFDKFSAINKIVIAGGLSKDSFLVEGIASCLNKKVLVLQESEASLIGVARFAAGWHSYSNPIFTEVSPVKEGFYLKDKFIKWQNWMVELLK